MEASRCFAKEVDKIVVAPYAVSLKSLLRILSHVSTNELCIWSLTKTCQIHPLVSRLLQSISTDRCAKAVLYSLIRAERIRDYILLHRLSALEDVFFLTGETHDACLLFFDTKLPETIALPNSAVAFIEQVLSNESGTSTRTWIRRVQKVLHSCGPGILEVISDAVVQGCFDSWSLIIKNNQNFEFLCCLDIACVLQHLATEYDIICSMNSTINTELGIMKSWISRAHGLLTLKSGKLVRSLLLRALYFVSDKPDMMIDHATEAAVMIKSVLMNIDHVAIQTTMKEQENLDALKKLIKKVNCTKAGSLLQLIMFEIIQILDPAFSPSQASFSILVEDILTSAQDTGVFVHQAHYIDAIQHTLICCTSVNQLPAGITEHESEHTGYLKECLEFAIDQCMPGAQPSINNTLRLEQVSVLMKAIRQAVNTYDETEFVQSISFPEIPEWWSMSSVVPQNAQNCAFLETCPHVFEAHRQRIMLEIANLIMQMSCVYGLPLGRSNHERLSRHIPHAVSEHSNHECAYVLPEEYKPLGATPTRQSVNWKNNLNQELAILTEKTCEIVQFHVDMTCRDLADRCDNVEEPLRAMKSHVQKLEEQLARSTACAELIAVEHADRCQVLKAEIRDLQESLEAVRQMNQSMRQQQATDEAHWRAEMEVLRSSNVSLGRTIADMRTEGTELNDLLKERDEAIQQLRSEGEACASTRDVLHLELSEARDKEKKLLAVLFENKDA